MLNPGDVLGDDFEIEAPLGRGGMGAVFRARQRSTDALRAIKIMLPEWAVSPSLRERFEREARASGRIRSDHVVKIIAHGVDPARKMPWIAMEYLTGATLEERMSALGVPPNHTAVELLRQLFHGVAAAHAVGIVHRDLKPPNVHVSESYRADVPFTLKVLDFGIAKSLAAQPTATHAMGTRPWMAPEQADTSGFVGPSADVWALGLVTFWLLTGRYFWRNVEGSEVELLHEVHFAKLPSADERLSELGLPALGPEFCLWLERCLSRDPAGRFPDAAAAWIALAPVLHALPSESPWSRAFRSDAPSHEHIAKAPAPKVLRAPQTFGLTPAPVARDPAPSLERGALLRWTMLSMFVMFALAGSVLWMVFHRHVEAMVAAALPGASPSAALLEPAHALLAPPAVEAPPGMVYVAPGSFEMGTGDAEPAGPAHAVRLSHGFFIDIMEATAKDYDTCVRDRACTPSSVHGPNVTAQEIAEFSHLCNGSKSDRERHPVNCIDYDQASKFCEHQGKRLPTEAEWEYAARGKDRRAYPWGNEAPTTCDVAVVSGLCPATGTQPTGTRAIGSMSPTGALDMAGNVWEWVADNWDPSAYRNAGTDDPLVRVPSDYGVLRGGSWDFAPVHATTTQRQRFERRSGHVSTGVRCARSATH